VFGYNLYIYIYIYRCKNMLLRFYGPEMALVVNGTQALSAVAETERSRLLLGSTQPPIQLVTGALSRG
jgi:hypothetical protein